MLGAPPPGYAPPAILRQPTMGVPGMGMPSAQGAGRPVGGVAQGMPALSNNPMLQQQQMLMLLKLLHGGVK